MTKFWYQKTLTSTTKTAMIMLLLILFSSITALSNAAQWKNYVNELKAKNLPVDIILVIQDHVNIEPLASGRTLPHYDAATLSKGGTIRLQQSSLTTGNVIKCDLAPNRFSQVYHEAVHAYWDIKGEESETHIMYKLVHGIANELKDREVEACKGSRSTAPSKVTLTEGEALWYAEEAVAYAVQALVKFHADYYNNPTYISGRDLTKEGRKRFISILNKERTSGYFTRGSDNYYLYDRALTDYALNQAFELMNARFRINTIEGLSLTKFTKYRVFGPINGKLTHDNDGYAEEYFAGESLKNFTAEATFYNPYSPTEGTWDYGFTFRRRNTSDMYTIFVRANGQWEQWIKIGGNWQQIASKTATGLVTQEGKKNHLKIIIVGDVGRLYVNGEAIAVLNVSKLVIRGDVTAATGQKSGSEIPGKITKFGDFAVWSLE